MRRLTLLLAFVVGLALAAPLAQAQTNAILLLRLEPQQDALTPENRTVTLHGTATFIADAGAYQHLSGVPVTYHVVAQPAWATVIVTPASDVFPVPAAPGLVLQSTRSFTVEVHVAKGVEESALDLLEVDAVAEGGHTRGARSASAAIPLVFLGKDSVCDAQNPFALLDEAEAQETDAGLVVQGGGAPVGTPWLAVGGFGLVGAGAGLLLRRRL